MHNHFIEMGIREMEGLLSEVIVSVFFSHLLPVFPSCFQLECAEDDGWVQSSESMPRGTAGTHSPPRGSQGKSASIQHDALAASSNSSSEGVFRVRGLRVTPVWDKGLT